jgi:hypothetical protein
VLESTRPLAEAFKIMLFASHPAFSATFERPFPSSLPTCLPSSP